jgi:hypothetical protein
MAIDLINYAFIRGKWYSFIDAPTAQQAIQKYSGNVDSIRTSKPVGVLIDETLLNINMNQWPDAVADAAGVTGDALINPPVNPITGPVTEVAPTPAVTPSMEVGSPAPSSPAIEKPVEEVDPWANLDQQKLNLAKRYADAGMMGRASSAFKDAGGAWDRTTSQRLRTEAKDTSRYGGDFDWSTYGIQQRDFGAISDMAKRGKFGKIKNMVEGAGGAWDKNLHVKLAAEYQGKGGTEGKPVRTQPSTTQQIYKTGSKDWNKQFQGTRADIEGKFAKGTGNRGAAKDWRQRHMGAIEKKYSGQELKDKRQAVARRHKIMIGK